MTIRNLNWELETSFNRKQVLAMAEVAKFVGNIEKDLSNNFPSSCKNIDWRSGVGVARQVKVRRDLEC